MLQIFALLCGLCAWTMGICSIVRQKGGKERADRLRGWSWFFCAVALYIPALCQFLEFQTNDLAGIIDCVSAYHLLSAILLAVNAILTVISVVSQKKDG